jgi:deazaflavin-dependent oxidoreductase (nitroreductase family)
VSAPTASPYGRLTAFAAALLRRRLIVRAPIALYRARLGFVLGRRLLMLEHTGRNSGVRRRVILEIVDHPRPATYIVASGFGARAQWFRNVRADPRVRIQVGSRPPALATARMLTAEQAATAVKAYAARHPRAWASLRPVFEATLGAQIDALPMVAFDLADAGDRNAASRRHDHHHKDGIGNAGL